MRWNELSEENCSMARTVSVIGDRWTLLILRDCFLRVRRFEDFQERLGITRPILASRLRKLVDEFVLVKVPYQQRPPRYEYRLTQKGLDLCPHGRQERAPNAAHSPSLRQGFRSGHGVLRMRRADHGEAGPCPSGPRRQKPATSANGDRSPGHSPYRERQSGGKLRRRLCRPRLISRQGGAISQTRRDPLQIGLAR
jgi:DNA-binding HxlR family transcriptional regulator